jgi:hypothetical protein
MTAHTKIGSAAVVLTSTPGNVPELAMTLLLVLTV